MSLHWDSLVGVSTHAPSFCLDGYLYESFCHACGIACSIALVVNVCGKICMHNNNMHKRRGSSMHITDGKVVLQYWSSSECV